MEARSFPGGFEGESIDSLEPTLTMRLSGDFFDTNIDRVLVPWLYILKQFSFCTKRGQWLDPPSNQYLRISYTLGFWVIVPRIHDIRRASFNLASEPYPHASWCSTPGIKFVVVHVDTMCQIPVWDDYFACCYTSSCINGVNWDPEACLDDKHVSFRIHSDPARGGQIPDDRSESISWSNYNAAQRGWSTWAI